MNTPLSIGRTPILLIAVALLFTALHVAAFSIGDRVQVINGPIYVRYSAGGTWTGYTQPTGSQGTVTGGPTVAQIGGTGTYYNWYNVNFDTGTDGWVADVGLTSASLPNLTPYLISGWSDKIVVSRTTGATTDSTSLTTADSLYVNWAVANLGAAPAGAFYVYVYVDGTYKGYGYMASLNASTYTYWHDLLIGSLSAGTHTIMITADATYAVTESNENDNSCTKTITVTTPALPNLTPYQPSGWSDRIVVSRTAGTTTDSTGLTTADTLYLDWAVINNGTAATAATFNSTLFVDGVGTYTWLTSPPMNANTWQQVLDYSLGSLSAGTHTLTISVDYGGAIAESNESDNSYTKTITVTTANLPAPILSTPANASTGQSTTPVFAWSQVSGATSYRIIVATSAADLPTDPTASTGGPSVVINDTTTGTSHVSTTALSSGTTYYWEVHARNATQFGVWSTAYSFTTAAPAPIIRIQPTTLAFDETISAGAAAPSSAPQLPSSRPAPSPLAAKAVEDPSWATQATVPDRIVIRFRTSEAAILHSQALTAPSSREAHWLTPPAGFKALPDDISSLRPYSSGTARATRLIKNNKAIQDSLSAATNAPSSLAPTITGYLAQQAEPDDSLGLFYAKLRKGTDTQALCLKLTHRDDVIYAHAIPICHTTETPNDPLVNRMWNLSNLRVPQAWDIAGNTVGSVRVGVVDTGVRISHSDLAGRTADQKDVDPDNGDAYADSDPNNDDPAGHGTACAGIIAAIRDNSTLVAGIAPVTIIPVNAYSGLLNGEPQIAYYTDGIRWAVDHGASVISLSFGRHDTAPTPDEISAANYAQAHGVVVCAAAGNDNGNADDFYPAAIPYFISVSAVDDANIRVRPPKWWWGSDHGNTVDVCAPGQGAVGASSDSILTLGHASDTDWVNNFNGTSAATPQVAGVCALIKIANPNLNAAQIRHLLETTARDQVGDPAEDTPGWDQYHGYGLVNAFAAVSAAKASFVVFNDGAASLTVSSIVPQTTAPWVSLSTATPFQVAAGSSATVTVSIDFSQAPAGQSTTRLLVYSTDSGNSPYSGGVNVSVTRTPPAISVTPSSQDFGSIQTGTSADRSFTVQNTGGETLSGSASVAAPFSIVSGNPYSLTANQSTTVVIRYSPGSAGNDNQNVTFTGASGASRQVTGSAFLPTAKTPTIFPNGGTYQGSVQITLADTTTGADLHYTLDGTDPSTSSTLYSTPFVLTTTSTLKARAYATGYNASAISQASFTITPYPHPQLGRITLNSGTIQFTVTTASGATCVVQTSTDLIIWTSISTNTVPAGGVLQVNDSDLAGHPRRFYRALVR